VVSEVAVPFQIEDRHLEVVVEAVADEGCLLGDVVTGVQIMLLMVEIFSQEVTLQIQILHRHVIEEVGGEDADVLDLTLLQAWVRVLIMTFFIL